MSTTTPITDVQRSSRPDAREHLTLRAALEAYGARLHTWFGATSCSTPLLVSEPEHAFAYVSEHEECADRG